MKEKVLILGLSKSGIAAAKFANKQGYEVYITESKSLDKVKEENTTIKQSIENIESETEKGVGSFNTGLSDTEE